MGAEAAGSASGALDRAGLEAWAAEAGRVAVREGLVVALRGPLGAGKTAFIRAACRGAGVEDRVLSPTFVLHRRYRTGAGRAVHHVDLYRLSGPAELDDLGWDELVAGEEAVFVEWAERAEGRLPADRWEVRLGFVGTDQPERRRVEAQSIGSAPPLPAIPAAAPC